jgi:aminoacyl tRNA synthase complex-interacting multifunctional protein 1
MKLSARDARAARACLLTASLAGVDLSFEPHGKADGGDAFSLTLADGTTVIDQPNAAAFAIAQAAAAPGTKAALLGEGTDKEARAQIADWLSSVHSTLALINDDALKVLNDALLDRTFLVASTSSISTSFGTSPSLADVVVAAHVADACSAFPEAQLAHFPCVARWYDHVAALIGGKVVEGKPLLPRGRLDRPSLKAPATPGAAGAGTVAPAKGKGDDSKKKGGAGAAAAAAAATAAPAAAAGAAGAAAATGAAGAATAAVPAAAEGDAAVGGGGKKKEKKAKAAPAAPAADAAPARPDDAFDLLDVRVGKVVAAQKHPDADSLYQEEIDLGEESGPRTIVSGLAKWIPLEQFQGRMVCVVTNLVKEREREKREKRERREKGKEREEKERERQR